VFADEGEPLERIELDEDGNGKPERVFLYTRGKLSGESSDTNRDGVLDRFDRLDESGSLVLREEDTDADGVIDVLMSDGPEVVMNAGGTRVHSQGSEGMGPNAFFEALGSPHPSVNGEIGDDAVGFHAQQAIEKWLKAVIASRGEDFEFTHDLHRLVMLASNGTGELPFDVDLVLTLTQYAVPLRYEDLLDAQALDRDATATLVEEVGLWAEAELSAAG